MKGGEQLNIKIKGDKLAKSVADWLEANKKASPAEEAAFIKAACATPILAHNKNSNVFEFEQDMVEFVGESNETEESRKIA